MGCRHPKSVADNILPPTSPPSDLSQFQLKTVEEIEKLEDSVENMLDKLEDRVLDSVRQNEQSLFSIKDHVVSTLSQELRYAKDADISADEKSEDRLMKESKDSRELIFSALDRLNQQIAENIMESKQEVLRLLEATKAEMLASQEQLISTYTSRIIGQVIFVCGFAVGLITEYDYYKEKALFIWNWLVGRRHQLDNAAGRKKIFFFF